MESSQCLFRGLVLQPSGFGPVVRQAFWTWSLCGSLSSLGLLSQVLPGCDTTNCAVPGKDSHNNTIRTLERSLLAADTDGYADTESGTSHECAVRVPKGLQRLEHYVLTHNLSQVDLSAALTGQQRFQGGERREGLQQAPGLEEEVRPRRRDHGGPFSRSDCCCVSGAAVILQS